MDTFRDFLRNKRNLASLLVLVFIALSLPLGLYLMKQQQTYKSSAAGELIQLVEGPCVQTINNKKTAICNTISIKLFNPFASGSASIAPSPTSTASATTSSPSPQTASPSPSPTAGSSVANCPTTVSTGAELIAAMSCYKNSGGTNRRLTLPAGTFSVDKKVSVPSNLTIAGAGMGSTIITKSGSFSTDDALMANDSSAGQENIVLRDFTLQGDGQRSGNSCCYGLKLQNINGAYVINVAANNWGIDGIFLGQRPNKPGATNVRITGCQVNNNGRNGISLVDGSNNVIDHCTLSGNSTNELVAAIDLEPDNGNTVSNNHIFENSITGNRNNGIQILQNPHDPGGIVSNNFVCNNSFGGNNGTDFDDKGSGTSTSGCTEGNLTLPTAMVPVSPQPVAFSLFHLLPHFQVDAATATPSASAPTTTSYRLAETQAGLSSSQWVSYTSSPIVTSFSVSQTPGSKEIWVQFINPSGQTITDHLPAFDLLAPMPTVSGVNCTVDLTQKNLKITVTGTNLGTTKGTLTANGTALETASWDNTTIVGLLTTSTAPQTGQKYAVVVKRADSLQSTAQSCQVNTTSLSLGARVFCRAAGQFDMANVKITIAPVSTPDKSVEETVTIDKDGVIQGIKTKLQSGQSYIISVKAPFSVRRNTTITAQEGTSVANTSDGKPFILPIGDIAPSTPDGQINGLDRAELVKQWRILNSSASATLTGDFNRDKKVNSIDWACMKYDFNAKDDAPGTTGSTYTKGLNVLNGQGSAAFSY